MSVHTGTHVDAPLHFDGSATDMAGVCLQPYIGPARVMPMPVEKAVSAAELEGCDWVGVERVLFKTRSSDLPEDCFRRDYAYVTEDGAEFLGRLGLQLVGTDAPSVDPFDSKELRAHRALLRHGVAILEGLRLGHVPPPATLSSSACRSNSRDWTAHPSAPSSVGEVGWKAADPERRRRSDLDKPNNCSR